MAAFCTCCGAAITMKNERCMVCGAPRHGMTSAPAKLSFFKKTEKAPTLPNESMNKLCCRTNPAA